MGQDISNGVKAQLDIPNSLRSVHPFLYEAQRGLIHLQSPQDGDSILRRKRIVITCINRAFKLLNLFNLDLDAPGQQCVGYYTAIRDSLVIDIVQGQAVDASSLCVFVNAYNRFAQTPRPHELLFAEANETLALAEEQYREGFIQNASLNFHCAGVYYRVMEAMLPGAYDAVHHQLQFCISRLKCTSSMSLNFIREHFTDGASCAELYEVHGSARLGKGSYGSVYLATHRVTGDERAVKVMNVERVTSYYLRKLHTEIEVLKSLDHPNIVRIQDVFFGKRSVYVVTDLCRGGELFELLNSGKSQGFVFREDRAATLMRDMVSAVHYLHSKCIMHRDLKLENFLFASKSTTSSLILIDFGLSKRFEPGEVLSQRVGSCYYTAPEVLLGSYDYRCDVWSLGVLCFMLLSGSPPFYGNTADDVYEGILNHEVAYPEKKFRQVSSVCMDFLRRLLVKDPNLRMSTAVALAHPFISGALTTALPFSSSPPTIPPLASSALTSSIIDSLPFGAGSLFGSAINSLDAVGLRRHTALISNDTTVATGPMPPAGGAIDPAATVANRKPHSPSHFSFSPNAIQVHQQQRQVAELSLHLPAHQNLCYTPGSLAAHAAALVATGTVSCYGRFTMEEADAIVNSVCHFVHADPLIKLTLLMISHSIPPEEILQFRQEFQRIDSDHNGTLSLQEFTSALSLSSRIYSREVDCTVTYLAMCIERSHGHCSELTYHEYIAAAMCGRLEIDPARVHLAFDTLDADEVGVITMDSVRKALGNDIPEHILVAMIRPLELQSGSDGVNIDRFVHHWSIKTEAWMMRTPPPDRALLPKGPTDLTSPTSITVRSNDTFHSDKPGHMQMEASEIDARPRVVTFAPGDIAKPGNEATTLPQTIDDGSALINGNGKRVGMVEPHSIDMEY